MRRILPLLALPVIAVTALAGCGSNDKSTASARPDANTPLVIGASPVPHADILRFVAKDLAPNAGLKLKIVEFTDYVQPNVALDEGKLDANFFQHKPYLDEQVKSRGYEFEPVAAVHVEPLGIYSKSVKALDAVPKGAVVAIPNDPTNGGRALQLLAANGLITLKDGVGVTATVRDIQDNPHDLKVKELEAAQIPRSLQDTALSVINTNYALEAKLDPKQDALAVEKGEGNPFANLLVARKDDAQDPRVQKLAKLLNDPKVKQFIDEKYRGAIIPAF